MRAVRTDFAYEKGHQNVKAGAVYEQTFLNENDSLGVVDPGYLDTLTDANGNPCMSGGTPDMPLDSPCTDLYPYDLTRGGTNCHFVGHTDIKELVLYPEDRITLGNTAVQHRGGQVVSADSVLAEPPGAKLIDYL